MGLSEASTGRSSDGMASVVARSWRKTTVGCQRNCTVTKERYGESEYYWNEKASKKHCCFASRKK